MTPLNLRSRIKARGHSFKRSFDSFLHGPAEKLLFEHIPKCGGTSVKEYLKSHYSNRKVFEIDGMDVDRSLNEFRAMSQQERFSFHLVLGHGAHKLRELFLPQVNRLTILRDPVDRIVSHYFFARQSPGHYLHGEIVKRDMTLAQYATSDLSPELRNNYVRRFIGVRAEEAEKTPRETIASVIDLLQTDYSVVGILEDLEDGMRRLADVCNFHSTFRSHERMNVTDTRPNVVDAETLRLIAEVNFLDVEIYKRMRVIARERGYSRTTSD